MQEKNPPSSMRWLTAIEGLNPARSFCFEIGPEIHVSAIELIYSKESGVTIMCGGFKCGLGFGANISRRLPSNLMPVKSQIYALNGR
jgi:hypothetical protein